MSHEEIPPPFGVGGGLPHIATEPAGPCAVCHGRTFAAYADGFDFELQTCRNHWHFARCTDCGHVQLDPRPIAQALPVIYPPHYYSYAMEESVGAIAMAGKTALDRAKFRDFLKYLPRPATSYLDIGCGDIKYLKLMQRYGIKPEWIYGLELDDAVVAKGRALGFQLFNERAETSKSIPENAIDLITMFHVIEHVADPAIVLDGASRRLSEDGILVIETPNTDAWDARLFLRRYWGGYHIPRHWHLFTPKGITRLLEDRGFHVLSIRYQTGHSFWLYSFHHALRYNRIMPSARLARLFDPLHSLPLLIVATLWDKLRAFLGYKTSAMLIIARRSR